ncbi:MAG: PhzF family phenazine biosynthesis protein [Planctomycetota bacterium]
MKKRFYTCDVFTEKRFGGNPLAVFPEATGLTSDQMQTIAREFNYSESTFVLPAEQGNTRKVRIFTPTREVPFAGHPNVGTAFVLATIGELGDLSESTQIVFEENAGLVPITIRNAADKPLWCELKAPEQVSIGASVSVETAAAALGLDAEDIVTTNHLPQVASVGLSFLIVELRDRSALERAWGNVPVIHEIEAAGITPDIHVYVRSEDEFDLRTRMFAPTDNIAEDPATGSANCALVGMLSAIAPENESESTWHIAQGFEMGRPSILDARTEKRDGQVTGVWIAGSSVMVTEGHLEID